MKNSSERAFISDLTMLALVNPEMINEGSECMNNFEEAYDDEYMEDFDIMYMALDDAIACGDKDEVKYIRQDIQREKTRQRMVRKLNAENKTIRDLLTT